jgi:hypothetical protein
VKKPSPCYFAFTAFKKSMEETEGVKVPLLLKKAVKKDDTPPEMKAYFVTDLNTSGPKLGKGSTRYLRGDMKCSDQMKAFRRSTWHTNKLPHDTGLPKIVNLADKELKDEDGKPLVERAEKILKDKLSSPLRMEGEKDYVKEFRRAVNYPNAVGTHEKRTYAIGVLRDGKLTCVCLFFTTSKAIEISYIAASDPGSGGTGGGGFFAWLFCRKVGIDRGLAILYLRSVVAQMDRDLKWKDPDNAGRCIANECWLENVPRGTSVDDILSHAKLWDKNAACKFLVTEPTSCVVHFKDCETAKFYMHAVNFHYTYLQKADESKQEVKGKAPAKKKKPIKAFLDADRCDNTEKFYLERLYLESACNHQLLRKVEKALGLETGYLGNGTVLERFYTVFKGLSRNPKDADTHPYVDVLSYSED